MFLRDFWSNMEETSGPLSAGIPFCLRVLKSAVMATAPGYLSCRVQLQGSSSGDTVVLLAHARNVRKSLCPNSSLRQSNKQRREHAHSEQLVHIWGIILCAFVCFAIFGLVQQLLLQKTFRFPRRQLKIFRRKCALVIVVCIAMTSPFIQGEVNSPLSMLLLLYLLIVCLAVITFNPRPDCRNLFSHRGQEAHSFVETLTSYLSACRILVRVVISPPLRS